MSRNVYILGDQLLYIARIQHFICFELIFPSQKNLLILILNHFCSKNDEEFADYGLQNGSEGCMEMVVIRASTACHEHDKRLHLGTVEYMLNYIATSLYAICRWILFIKIQGNDIHLQIDRLPIFKKISKFFRLILVTNHPV